MKSILSTVKVLVLLAVAALTMVSLYPAESTATEMALAEFCPTSTDDSCGVNPSTGHYFKKQTAPE